MENLPVAIYSYFSCKLPLFNRQTHTFAAGYRHDTKENILIRVANFHPYILFRLESFPPVQGAEQHSLLQTALKESNEPIRCV